jgi:hypothetical protein
MLKYLIRRRSGVYVESIGLPLGWTRRVGFARHFGTKREAIAFISAAELPLDECEVVTRARVATDAKIERACKRADLRELVIFDPGETSTDPRPTDRGLASVGEMATLEHLEIHAKAVTNSGLLYLDKLTALRKLHIKGTQVTQNGIESLRKALTKCEILWTPTARIVTTSDAPKPRRPMEHKTPRQRAKEKAEEARAAKRRELASQQKIATQKKSAAANWKARRH